MSFRKRIIIAKIAGIIFSVGILAQEYSYDYKNMSKDQYVTEIRKLEKREADAKSKIQQEEASIAQLKPQLMTVQKELDGLMEGMYELLGINKDNYDKFVRECQALEEDVNSFLMLSPSEMNSRQGDIQGYKKRLADFRKFKVSSGPHPYKILQRVEGLISQIEEKQMMQAPTTQYEVKQGDYLWKIAGKLEILRDPLAWLRIYAYNREQIKNPNLIHPNQVLVIPQKPAKRQHWVKKGESLGDIARQYGHPFTWQNLYEVNKKTIGDDPNIIYPHTVLVLEK